MRPAALTRFHWSLFIALVLCVVALAMSRTIFLAIILLLFAIIMGLGVALPQMKFFGPYVCQGRSSRRCVALTFDDGPDPRSTIPLLDLLRQSNVSAAFFCIGKRVAAHPELAARIAREGHLVENHTWSHSNGTNFFTVARLRDELDRTQTAIQKSTGSAPTCFRPPIGLSNPRIFRAARDAGLKVVGWTARGIDTRIKDPERIVQRIVRGLRPGAIVLLHDGNIPPERLLVTVERLLDRIRGQGYEVVRLDRMLQDY